MGIFVDFFHFGPNFNPDAAPLALTLAPPIFGSQVFFANPVKKEGVTFRNRKIVPYPVPTGHIKLLNTAI